MNRKVTQIVISLWVVTIHACSNSPTTPMVTSLPSTHSSTAPNTTIPISTLTATPTRTPHPTSTTTPLPAWVTNFAEPILAVIKDQSPGFQDDFSRSSGNGWYVGFIEHPNYVLTIEQGVLIIKEKANENEYCDPISNLAMTHPNFVLQVDLPENRGELSFHGTIGGDPLHSLNVQRPGLRLQWSFGSRDGQQQFGDFIKTNSDANGTQVIIIKKGSEAAFYLDGIPQAYIDDPLLNEPAYEVELRCGKFDNVKFWNLDRFPNLP